MVNEIPTLLLNETPGPSTSGAWYIDPGFISVTIPESIRNAYTCLIGDSTDSRIKNIRGLMPVILNEDMSDMLYVFDGRTTCSWKQDNGIYGLFKNSNSSNSLTDFVRSETHIRAVMTGDEYMEKLWKRYAMSHEGTIKIASAALAIAYKLKLVHGK